MITCKFEDGGEAALRHATVAAIILNEKGELLLGKRANHLREGGKYNLVGGFMNRDESVQECVKREILEETGYEVVIDYLFFIHDKPVVAGSDWQNISFNFVVHVSTKVSDQDNESTEIQWFSFDSLPPKEEFGFDHYGRIEVYKRHLQHPFTIPFMLSEIM